MRGEGLAPNALLVRLPERLRSNQKGREVSATGYFRRPSTSGRSPGSMQRQPVPDGTQDRVDDATEEDLGDDRDDRDKKAVRLRDRTSRDPRSSARFRA
jgi:hypothetical protein